MSYTKHAKILFLEKSINETNHWLSFFADDGFCVDSGFVSNIGALEEQLTAKNWDLAVIKVARSITIKTDEAVKLIKEKRQQLPIILLYSGSLYGGYVHWMHQGVYDAIPTKIPQRLVLSAERAIKTKRLNESISDHITTLPFITPYELKILNHCNLGIIRLKDNKISYINRKAKTLFKIKESDSALEMDIQQLLDLKYSNKSMESIINSTSKNYEIFDISNVIGVMNEGEKFNCKLSVIPYIDEGKKIHTQLLIDKVQTIDQSQLPSKSENTNHNGNLKVCQNLLIEPYAGQLQSLLNDIALDESYFCILRIENYNALQNVLSEEKIMIIPDLVTSLLYDKFDLSCINLMHSGSFFFIHKHPNESLKKIIKQIGQLPIDDNNHTVNIAVCIGAVKANRCCHLTDQLFELEKALFKSKDKGLNNYYIITNEETIIAKVQAGDQFAMLEYALHHKQLFIMFQPIVSLNKDMPTCPHSYEVSLCIKRDNDEYLQAEQIITEIKNTSLAVQIDRWVVIQAIKHILWQAKNDTSICLYVHLSAGTLHDQKFLAWLYLVVKKSKVLPENLVFQVNETLLVKNLKLIKHITTSFQKIGCKSCITNFGLMLDSCKLLADLNVNFIKISPEYSDTTQVSLESKFKGLIEMLKAGCSTQIIMPNIESSEQLESIQSLQIDYIQGNFIQPPQRNMSYNFKLD